MTLNDLIGPAVVAAIVHSDLGGGALTFLEYRDRKLGNGRSFDLP